MECSFSPPFFISIRRRGFQMRSAKLVPLLDVFLIRYSSVAPASLYPSWPNALEQAVAEDLRLSLLVAV